MKKLLLFKNQGFKTILLLGLLFLFSNNSWGQQVIGSFPYMNGGFEGQTSGALGTALSATSWSRQSQAGASSSIATTTPRTGVNYANVANVTAASRGLQSPQPTTFVAANSPTASTAYIVQFFVKNSTSIAAFQVGTNTNGTTSTNYSSSTYALPVNTNWTKYSFATLTNAAAVTSAGIAVVGRCITGNFDVDDVVIYPGTFADVLAPDAPTSPSITTLTSTSQTVSWTAPSTGVDGGGYMVVRSTADPSTAPNANGIYAVGNFITGTEQVVYLGTASTFTDTLPLAGNYYYRVYTVDKAFNYSAAPAKIGNSTYIALASSPTIQTTNLTFGSLSSTSVTLNFTVGDGTKSIVVMSSSPITTNPVDGVTYTTSSNISGGTQVVYIGSSTIPTINLSRGFYYFRVFTFNGSAGSEKYLITNPISGSQLVGSNITSNGTNGGAWTATTTWTGGVVPSPSDNVTILGTDVIDVNATSGQTCFNLTINSGGKVWANTSAQTLGIYGTSLVCNGTFGDPINLITTGSVLTTEFGGNLIISGSGGIYPFKIRPITGIQNIGVTFDANVSVTGTGTTVMFDNIGNDNIYYTVNSPRTLNIATNFNTCSSSATQSTSNNTLTINSGATVNVVGVLNTNELAGKTYTANINGILSVTGNSTLSNTSGGGVATFNVNGTYTSTGNLSVTPIGSAVAPIINVGSTGSIIVAGTADFSNPSLVGYIGNAPTTTGGIFTLSSTGSIKLANATGLEPIAGPIRTTTRNFTSGTSYSFVGNVNQVTGSEIPASITNLTIATLSPASVTLTNTTDLTGKLAVNSGTFNTDGKLTLKSTECCTASVSQILSIDANPIIGDVKVERFIPAKRAWRALTAPLKGATNNSIFNNWQNGGNSNLTGVGVELWSSTGGNGMASGPSNSILQYNNSGATGVWDPVTNTNINLFDASINNPFMVFVTGSYGSNSIASTIPAANTTLKATGQLITGDKSYTTTANKYTFIGNPYASPLDLSLMLNTLSNATTSFGGNIWIWDAKGLGQNGLGAFNLYDNSVQTYSNVTTPPVTSDITTAAATQIQSGQAFFVKSTDSANFNIKESHKGTAVSNNNVFRSGTPELLRVGLYKQENNEWSGRDGAMTVILSDANANQSPNKMVNSTENIAFTKNGANFASNHHLPLVSSDVLNVKVWNTTAGANYKLKINTEAFTATNLSATLEDLFTNSRTPLTLDGAAVEYPFTVTTDALSSGDRFRIVFQNAVLGTTIPTTNGFQIVPNPVTGDSFQVNLGTLATGTYSYSICNAIGQEVEKGTLNNATQNTNYEVKMSTSATGIYVMKIKGSDNSVFTAKIIKK
jgi:hypothetical protein